MSNSMYVQRGASKKQCPNYTKKEKAQKTILKIMQKPTPFLRNLKSSEIKRKKIVSLKYLQKETFTANQEFLRRIL